MNFFQNNLSWIPSECQIVWIQIRPDVLSVFIWVQTACEDYHQTTKVEIVIFFIDDPKPTFSSARNAIIEPNMNALHQKKCNEIALRAIRQIRSIFDLA